MGKAVDNTSDQFRYVKNRIDMLHQVVSSMDPDDLDPEDFQRVHHMVEQLHMKMDRFKKDQDAQQS
ncbi:hypothetical protein GLW04_10530 [Halobacillus litoralis]|uniref:Uncharacterized protein n=1 Tax=Halobacillus litoralis TaxID=45668 RepID=A0A845DUZ4_9BACI|nr:SE1561 family protein [Halobacillus litoralis]MCA1020840.1 hypothetical protein [Halobacillus litoralis]MYL20325.1 hypothetical protein [Halobacillus litoralis]MYL29420.1 hypothetical protein [Halobacillus halophilus]MYL36637.1 hypothetical protein [Halobacillus litoralis]